MRILIAVMASASWVWAPIYGQVLPGITPVRVVSVIYPPLAQLTVVQGTVRLRADIDLDGKVLLVRIENGDTLLASDCQGLSDPLAVFRVPLLNWLYDYRQLYF